MPPVLGECWGSGWVQQPRNGEEGNKECTFTLHFWVLPFAQMCRDVSAVFSQPRSPTPPPHPALLLFPHPHPLRNTTQAAGTERSPIAWSPAASQKLPSARLLKPQVQTSTGKHNSGMEMKTPLYIQRQPRGSSGTEAAEVKQARLEGEEVEAFFIQQVY